MMNRLLNAGINAPTAINHSLLLNNLAVNLNYQGIENLLTVTHKTDVSSHNITQQESHMENKADIFDLLVVEFGSLKKLSEKMGVTYNCVYQWKARGKQIPLKNIGIIEELSQGRINRQMMRPDKFNATA